MKYVQEMFFWGGRYFFVCGGGRLGSCVRRHAGIADMRARTPLGMRQYYVMLFNFQDIGSVQFYLVNYMFYNYNTTPQTRAIITVRL